MHLHITDHKDNKMDLIKSINTSTDNPTCNQFRKTSTVCKKCYAVTLEKMYPCIKIPFTRNAAQLIKNITWVNLPRFQDYDVVRFHSLGELQNYQHGLNFFRIAEKNKNAPFSLWTKRYKLVQKLVRNYGKPKNLRLVYSNPQLNTNGFLPKYFDKVFNVWTKDKLVKINCGHRCRACMLCYSDNDTTVINERLK